MSCACLLCDNIIIAGDLNIHIETNSPHGKQLVQVIRSYSFEQLVDEPTHVSGGILDLMLCNSDIIKQESVHVDSDFTTSDHYPIFTTINAHCQTVKTTKEIVFRDLKSPGVMESINHDIFSFLLLEFSLCSTFQDSVSVLFNEVSAIVLTS